MNDDNIVMYIRRKVKEDKEGYSPEELQIIETILIPYANTGGMKAKAGKKVMVNIYLQTIKTWKYRRGKIGEVIWG